MSGKPTVRKRISDAARRLIAAGHVPMAGDLADTMLNGGLELTVPEMMEPLREVAVSVCRTVLKEDGRIGIPDGARRRYERVEQLSFEDLLSYGESQFRLIGRIKASTAEEFDAWAKAHPEADISVGDIMREIETRVGVESDE